MSGKVNSNTVNLAAASTDPLQLRLLGEKQVQAAVLRLDQIHPVISGNKWFKLRYHIAAARAQGSNSLLTFGGAYSNHIVALACAARQQGMSATGIIRGERPAQLSHTLQTAREYGMQLIFVDRKTYARKEEAPFIRELMAEHPDSYLVPEGGSGREGIRGCREILSLTDPISYSHIMCCIGTGTMFCGIAETLQPYQELIGIPVLKISPGSALAQQLSEHCSVLNRQCQILTGFEMGGYAKKDGSLFGFMNHFFSDTGIPTDFVYTAKLMRAFIRLVEMDRFAPNSRVLLVHSGGLQGNGSLPPDTLSW